MNARSMIAGSALLALSACCAHQSAIPAGVAPNYSTGPVRLMGKVLKDDAGNTVTLRLDESAASKSEPLVVTDKNGARVDTREYPLGDLVLCKADRRAAISGSESEKAAHPPCETAASVTDGTFIKFGTNTCRCTTVFQTLRCYGTTCP